jgi:glutamine cyclotransferase
LEEIKMRIHANIEYSDEIMALTPQKRKVHLLTITEK